MLRVKKLTIYAGDREKAKALREGTPDIAGTCKVEETKVLSRKGEGRAVGQYADVRFVAEY